jgi:hypothetical protein
MHIQGFGWLPASGGDYSEQSQPIKHLCNRIAGFPARQFSLQKPVAALQ